MSDPSSRSEIQDVLSSIRRLVSEDNRQAEGEAAARAANADDPGKLVLTPADRIDDDAARGATAAKASLEETIAELEAAVSGIGEDFEPDGSEVARTGHAASDPDLERAFETGFAVDTGMEGEAADLSHPVTGDRLDDGGGLTEAPAEPDVTDAHAEAPPEAAVTAGDGRQDTAGPGDSGLSAAHAATAAAAGAGRTRRLHLAAHDMVSDGRAPWGRLDAPDKAAEDWTATPPAVEDPALDAEAEADAALLREIVADIVRQELQGPLGERITRSVRMLVRREINRALASRGIE